MPLLLSFWTLGTQSFVLLHKPSVYLSLYINSALGQTSHLLSICTSAQHAFRRKHVATLTGGSLMTTVDQHANNTYLNRYQTLSFSENDFISSHTSSSAFLLLADFITASITEHWGSRPAIPHFLITRSNTEPESVPFDSVFALPIVIYFSCNCVRSIFSLI